MTIKRTKKLVSETNTMKRWDAMRWHGGNENIKT